jgi:hypothetical protein
MAADDPWLVHMQSKGMKPYLEKQEAEIEKELSELYEKAGWPKCLCHESAEVLSPTSACFIEELREGRS